MMKKILLGTSAMVGAAVLLAGPALAAGPTLKITGLIRFEYWGLSQSKVASEQYGKYTNNQGFNTNVDDTRIFFHADGVADNGLQYGMYSRLQSGTAADTAQFDDTYLYIGGNWGRLLMGSYDPIQDVYKINGSSITADKEFAWDGKKPFQTMGNTAKIDDYLHPDVNANQVTYQTPDFGGLTVGVTYMPDRKAGQRGLYTSVEQGSGGFGTTSGVESNVFGAGFDFVHDFKPVKLEITGRYEHGDFLGNDTGNPATKLEKNNDYGFGVKVSYMGFDFVGSYANMGNQNYGGTVTQADHAAGENGGWEADGGVRYTTGPYAVSVIYMYSEADMGTVLTSKAEAPGTSKDKVNYLAIGANYKAAPGLDLYAQYEYIDLDRYGTTSDNTANLFTLGTQISF